MAESFTVTYKSRAKSITIVVEREPLGWVMRWGNTVSLLGIRAPADLLLRALLELERLAMGGQPWEHEPRTVAPAESGASSGERSPGDD